MKIDEVTERLKIHIRHLHDTVKRLEMVAGHRDDLVHEYFPIKKNVDWLKKVELSMASHAETAAALESWLVQLDEELAISHQRLISGFATELDQLLSGSPMRVKKWGTGLAVGPFVLDILPEQLQVAVWYGPRQMRQPDIALDAITASELLRSYESRLGSGLSIEQLEDRLLIAYQRTGQGAETGWVALSDVLPQMALAVQTQSFNVNPSKNSYRSYERHDLSFDLFRLKTFGKSCQLQLRIATLSETSTKAGSLWIPSTLDVDDGTHNSAMRLERSPR